MVHLSCFYKLSVASLFHFSDIPYISPAGRPSGSTFPSSFLGPSPGTPANATITSVATPLNIRSDENSNHSFLFQNEIVFVLS